MSNPIDRIKENYDSMNATRRRISDFVLSNPADCCFLSIRDFAEKAGCTDVTLMSYSKSLGYDSFADFRKSIQDYVLEWSTPSGRMKSIADSGDDSDSFYKKIYEAERASIDRAFSNSKASDFIEAATLIKEKKCIYIAAHNASRVAAQYLKYRLLSIGVEISILDLSDGHQTISRIMSADSSDTLLISIATPPYGKATIALSKVCKDRGISVIAFTDYETSPLVSLSDIHFICPVLSGLRGIASSYVPFFALFDTLVFFYEYKEVQSSEKIDSKATEKEFVSLLEKLK